MNVTFHAADPRKKARPRLEGVLREGKDQLMIACAFCTSAGVALLKPHAARLKTPGSFVVVSWEKPTDFEALERLHRLIPGHLYVHFGSISPKEKKVGRSIMHSKVFFARNGQQCSLWTGSNNLTASATQGLNCEAAILLEGDRREQPFLDAVAHLEACRNQAHPFQSGMNGPGEVTVDKSETLIIHAIGQAGPPPWHCHLRLEDIRFDNLLAPPAGVRLHLYDPSALQHGWQIAVPHTSYMGALTALNLTAKHPSYSGIPAAWSEAGYVIDVGTGAFAPIFSPTKPGPPTITTQAVISISDIIQENEVWTTKKPTVKPSPVLLPSDYVAADQDMLQYFESSAVVPQGLVHTEIGGYERLMDLPSSELRKSDIKMLSDRHQINVRAEGAPEMLSHEFTTRHPFIYRAKYRL